MTKKSSRKSVAKVPDSPPRTNMEKTMRGIQRMIEGKEFGSIEDMNDFLASHSSKGLIASLGRAGMTAKDKAQELAFDAMEAASAAKARKLAQRALALDPDCVDALVVLTEINAPLAREAIDGLQKAVAAGERSLGARFFRDNRGHFWGLLETRPFMRAMEQLGGLLRAEGRLPEAIRVYERMLELNPNDNQGVRDLLLGLYLAVDELAGAAKLLRKYKEDTLANFSWGRVLERLLAADEPGARAALVKARKQNRFVEQYLCGQRRIPKEMPASFSPGSDEEATLCVETLAPVLVRHREAALWLRDQCARGAAARISKAAPEERLQ
ncbi:MAG: hypothetical protein WBG54_23140 [Acidobacteriaceae bacterium]